MNKKKDWVILTWRNEEYKSKYGLTIPAYRMYEAHERSCAEYMIDATTRRSEWIKRWPNFCRKCDGSGEDHWTENQSPLGSGEWWPMQMVDLCMCVCPEIPQQMKCPRCGKRIYGKVVAAFFVDVPQRILDEWGMTYEEAALESWTESENPCPACGWNWGNGKDDIAPSGLEGPCPCLENEDRPFYEPSKIQLILFLLFGDRFQHWFRYPLVHFPV